MNKFREFVDSLDYVKNAPGGKVVLYTVAFLGFSASIGLAIYTSK